MDSLYVTSTACGPEAGRSYTPYIPSMGTNDDDAALDDDADCVPSDLSTSRLSFVTSRAHTLPEGLSSFDSFEVDLSVDSDSSTYKAGDDGSPVPSSLAPLPRLPLLLGSLNISDPSTDCLTQSLPSIGLSCSAELPPLSSLRLCSLFFCLPSLLDFDFWFDLGLRDRASPASAAAVSLE